MPDLTARGRPPSIPIRPPTTRHPPPASRTRTPGDPRIQSEDDSPAGPGHKRRMTPFTLTAPPRVLLARGAIAALAGESARLGARALLVRGGPRPGPDAAEAALREAGVLAATIAVRAEPDLPALEAALTTARAAAPTHVIALGGGSAVDMGKALAALIPAPSGPMAHLEVVGKGRPLEAPPLPLLAAPTTAGTGAEATRNAVIAVPEHRRKVSLRDPAMLPATVLIDPDLAAGAPRAVTLASGLDAVVQVIEPFLSARANPLADALCADAIPRGLAALAVLMEREDPAAREDMARAAFASGLALASAGLGAVHGIAGVLGGLLPAGHGHLCGALLVPVLRANRAATGGGPRWDTLDALVARGLGAPPAPAETLLAEAVARWALPPLPAPPPGLDAAAAAEASRASSSMRANPADLPADTLRRIIEDALP